MPSVNMMMTEMLGLLLLQVVRRHLPVKILPSVTPSKKSFRSRNCRTPSCYISTAGADIKEMESITFSAAYSNNFIAPWSHLANSIRKPVIAAVAGYALGGGCELALMCDIIYCTASATFGQPEIKLGVIPGAGGSQRLTHAIGKSKAMELILTGKNFSGKEAGEWGVAAKVIDGGQNELLEEALKTAETVANYSRIAVVAAKEVVNKSQELSLREGVDYERRLFHGLFGSKDQKIGECLYDGQQSETLQSLIARRHECFH
jgi:enoyl-CoA hydratase